MKWESLLILPTLLWIGFATCTMPGPEGDESLDIRYRRVKSRSESTCKCGVANTEKKLDIPSVTNGDIVEPKNKYPWMINIEKDRRPYCGASILTPNFVLTAAHCFIEKTNITARKKCFNLRDGQKYCSVPLRKLRLVYLGPRDRKKYVSISSVIFDDRFDLSLNYDIALIKTARVLPCSRFTAPICLPTIGDGLFRANSMVTLAGWGSTQVVGKGRRSKRLREANLIITDDENSCKRKNKATHFCGLGKSQNICQVDSGGLVFQEHKGRNYVIGLSSYVTTADCNPNYPTVFTKVHEYLPWINKHLNPKSKLGPNDKKIKI